MQETSLPQDWLESASLWKTLSASEREKLLQRCTVSHYQAGQQIIGEADCDNRVMFIVQGSVYAGGNSASGKEVFYAKHDSGSVIGDFSAIDGLPRSASVYAFSDCIVISMPGSVFLEALENNSAFAMEQMARLTGFIRNLNRKVFEFNALNANKRLRAELLRMASDTGGNEGWIEKMPSQRELAAVISSHREGVSREMKNLERDGLIAKQGEHLKILDLAALQESAGEDY